MKELITKVRTKFALFAAVVVATVAPLALVGTAHAQEVTLDATQAANINGAVKSLPDAGIQFVFSTLQNALPYIVVVFAIFIALGLMFAWMKSHHK